MSWDGWLNNRVKADKKEMNVRPGFVADEKDRVSRDANDDFDPGALMATIDGIGVKVGSHTGPQPRNSGFHLKLSTNAECISQRDNEGGSGLQAPGGRVYITLHYYCFSSMSNLSTFLECIGGTTHVWLQVSDGLI